MPVSPPTPLRALCPSRSEYPRTLLDEHNAIHMLAGRMAAEEPRLLRRLVMAREARAFARYEVAMCRAYDAVLTVTEEDRCHLLALQETGGRDQERGGRSQEAGVSNLQSPIYNLQSKFTVIPICVDPEASRPVSKETRKQGNKETRKPPCLLVYPTPCLPP